MTQIEIIKNKIEAIKSAYRYGATEDRLFQMTCGSAPLIRYVLFLTEHGEVTC